MESKRDTQHSAYISNGLLIEPVWNRNELKITTKTVSIGHPIVMSRFKCAIEKVSDWHPHLFLEVHIVACVAVMRSHSASPAVFEVTCENIVSEWLGEETQFTLEVSWSTETERKAERLRATIQTRPIVEMAAAALVFILTPNIVHLGQLDVTNYGDRADYRSLDIQSVLEINGTETISELGRRHREKVAQALENPFGLDAYVVVCAFSTFGHLIRFSYHRWLEGIHA